MNEGKGILWCSVLKGKYGRGILEEGDIVAKPSDSLFGK